MLLLSEQDVFTTYFLILKSPGPSDPFYISPFLNSYIKYMKFRIETSQLVIRDILPRRQNVSSVQVFTYLICLCMRKRFRFTLLKADELFTVISVWVSDYILKCLLKKKYIPSDFNSFFEIRSLCLSMPWDNQLKRVKLRN